MKTLFLLPLLALLSLGWGCGCHSTPARVAYNVESAAVITVDQAMSAWGDYVNEFHPATDQEDAVKDAYEKYQFAMLASIDATQAYVTAKASGATNAAAMFADSTQAQGEAAA